jgi:hypothetical protein
MILLKSATNLEEVFPELYSIKKAQNFSALRHFCQVCEDEDRGVTNHVQVTVGVGFIFAINILLSMLN